MFGFLLTISGYRIYNRKRRCRKGAVTSYTHGKEIMKMKRNKLKNSRFFGLIQLNPRNIPKT